MTIGAGRNYEDSKAPSEVEIFGDPNKKAPAIIQAATLIKKSGFDGIEVHAMHWGYLLDEFGMSITNQRTDELCSR